MEKQVETVTVQEVADALGVAPMKIKNAILNGTMPIGAVMRDPHSTRDRTIIIKKRYEKWIGGEL